MCQNFCIFAKPLMLLKYLNIMMKKIIILLLLVCGGFGMCAQTATVQGDWTGSLKVSGVKLNLVFHFSKDACTMDSPDQGAKGVQAQILHFSDDSISVAIPKIGVKYFGHLQGDSIVGTFKQVFLSESLVLKRGEVKRNRPQTPKPPYPYAAKEITIQSGDAQLSGTLTMPENAAKAPLVLLISGSGQQNRDEELFEHKPFAVIADYLARNGVASFRYDDRGAGKSTGLDKNYTTEVAKNDAVEILKVLRRDVKASAYGICGHSEGGLIAFMIAGEQPKLVDYIITLAGTAERGDTIIKRQYKHLNPNFSDAQCQQLLQTAVSQSKWAEWFINYDPAQAIKAIKCPVMALNGELDTQVYADQNIKALKSLLKVKKGDVVKKYPGLNHLFQTATTGEATEYPNIEETISPLVLADILQWLKGLK